MLVLVGNFTPHLDIPQVNASPNELILFKENFDDLSHVYADDYSGVYIDGGALILNESIAKISGFHPVPRCYVELNITISYEESQTCGYWIVFGAGAQTRTRWDYGFDSISKESGVVMLLSEMDHNDAFRVARSYNGSFNYLYEKTDLHIQEHTYLTIKIYWDGINNKHSVWLNGDKVVDNKKMYNLYPEAIDPSSITVAPLVFNNLRFSRQGSASVPYQRLNVTHCKQYIETSSKVNAVAGKFMSLGFDAMHDSILDNAFPILRDENGFASMFADEYYQSSVAVSLTYAQVKSMADDYKWEMGIHYYLRLNDYDDYITIMDREYNWIYGNTTYKPLSFSVMHGASNWSDASYAWTHLNMIGRCWIVPTAQGRIADIGATFVGGATAPTDWGYKIHKNSLDKGMRVWFAWTHEVKDNPTANDCDKDWFESFCQNLTDANYRILPQRRGYDSLIYSYNTTFNIITDTASILEFSVSSNASKVYVWADKPNGSGTCYVYDNLYQRKQIYEDLSDKVGFWVENGKNYTVCSAKIDKSIDSVFPYYADITTVQRVESAFTLNISAPSGNTSTTKVYCGEKGEPLKVFINSIEQPINYNSSTKTLTITATHPSSPIEIVVDWNLYGPKASFVYSPLNPYTSDTVAFNASDSKPNGGHIVSYQWSFGDGLGGEGVTVPHIYNAAGTYEVTLNITDSEGLWNSTTTTVTVKMPPPPSVWKVEHSPEIPEYNNTVTITANITSQKSGIGVVTLKYFNGSMWTNITMTIEDDLYVAKIPALPYETTVQYKVYASNDFGNWAETDTFSYNVTDTIPPNIGPVEWNPQTPSTGEEVVVSVSVSEPFLASGVKNVTLLWSLFGKEIHSSKMTLQHDVWTAMIPRQSNDTTVFFSVESYDNAANRAQSQWYGYSVKVDNEGLPLGMIITITVMVILFIGTITYIVKFRKTKGSAMHALKFLRSNTSAFKNRNNSSTLETAHV